MNNKGFTLIELLAVVVILGIVIAIAATNVTTIRNNSMKKVLDTKINDLEGAAVVYGQENQRELTSSCTVSGVDYDFCKLVTVKDLIDNDYYETKETNDEGKNDLVNNVTRGSMLCDTVRIYRKNNRVYAVMSEVKSNDENFVCDLTLNNN